MDLEQLFSHASQSTEQVLQKVEPYEHPLLTLLKKELQKQQEMLLSILHVFRQKEGKPSLDSFKQECSVVYHANEMATSFSGSWKRAVSWTDHSAEAAASNVSAEMKEIKQLLSDAAEEIQHVYGKDAVKYVIPTFYLPA